MAWLRIIAALLALSLMIGEAWRSWGAGRPVMFWMDDMLMGAMLLAGAWLMGRPSRARHAFFAAAWGVNAGMLYGSFFGKVFAPETTNAGNFDLGLLTVLVGLAFATAVAGMIASIILAREER
ncbi:MAG: hypothetical protein HKN78_13455 [Sphingomonadaceae bacterium]|nr:hypothetical protein [Sphingomonadaceae bacterium]